MSQKQIRAATIVSSNSYNVHPKLTIAEYFFDVPLDYDKPDDISLRIFARSARQRGVAIVDEHGGQQLPWLLYLRGGPGSSCDPPQNYAQTSIFLDRGYQMLYLDSRGTGLSTPVTASTLSTRESTRAQAEYLKFFRADNIVRDCEAIRLALLHDYPEHQKQWSTLAQSFGGFCTTTYLSFHPEGLRECFIFGGLPPFVSQPDQLYTSLARRVITQNERYYAKFPGHIQRVRTIMNYLKAEGDGSISLPSGGSLTRRRFRQIGINLGFHGGFQRVHDIVLRASYEITAFGHLTRKALSSIEGATKFDDNILYAVLHEPAYCQGEAADWSAERITRELPEFDLDHEDGPIFFTGEMVFSWMFDDYAEFRLVRDAAQMIAQTKDWPALYDVARLAQNEVPVYAASYIRDMYVDFDFGSVTGEKINNCSVFVSDTLLHNALGTRTSKVVEELLNLRDDEIE